jgi:hypothetical protein
LQDVELYSDNFLVPALERLASLAAQFIQHPSPSVDSISTAGDDDSADHANSTMRNMKQSLQTFCRVTETRFQLKILGGAHSQSFADEHQRLHPDTVTGRRPTPITSNKTHSVPAEMRNGDFEEATNNEASSDVEDDEDEDGPVIVSLEEVEQSQARNNSNSATMVVGKEDGLARASSNPLLLTDVTADAEVTQTYPLLVASLLATNGQEDIIMTCARILEEQVDVSLVREAAAYLEEMEARRGGF